MRKCGRGFIFYLVKSRFVREGMKEILQTGSGIYNIYLYLRILGRPMSTPSTNVVCYCVAYEAKTTHRDHDSGGVVVVGVVVHGVTLLVSDR